MSSATTRREFIEAASLAGAGLALLPRLATGSTALRGQAAPKKMLVLGGTGFIGPHTVRTAVENGHEVTIFTRGRSQADLPEGVEHLVGDRDNDLTALEGRSWDVVIDNNARDYRWVQRSTELLEDAVGHYIFVSSISAYDMSTIGGYDVADRVLREPIVDEDYKRFEPEAGWNDGDEAHYGLTKTLAENICHEAFPGRTTVVRPGLIVGPGDPSDRFTYWPVRIDQGGEVMAPGNPEHANQIIDQRDLTEWIVRLAEDGVMGDFNATGPESRLSMAEMLYGIRAVTSAPLRFTWVAESFLEEQGIRPWGHMPAWMPGDALSFVNIQRALDAGLTFRPLALTAWDTLEWDKARPAEERENRSAGISLEREAELLAAWHAR